MMSVVP